MFIYAWFQYDTLKCARDPPVIIPFHFRNLFWLGRVTGTLKVTAKTLNPQDETLCAAGKLRLISIDSKTKTTAWHKSKVQSMLMRKWNGTSQNSSMNLRYEVANKRESGGQEREGKNQEWSNYGSNQSFLHEGATRLSPSHLHHNTACNINFRVYRLLEVQSMKSH